MAETNFQPRGDVKVIMGSGAKALGTAHVADDTWNALQVVDFNIEHASAPVEVAPSRSGVYAQMEKQGHHRPDTQIYEVTLTMRGTPTSVLKSCLSLFSEGSSAAALSGASNTGVMKDGVSNADQVTLLFENAGSDETNVDVVMAGCMATQMVLREDVGTNGGELVVETTFISGYQPVETALTPSSTPTLDEAAPKNIFDLSTSTLNSQVLVLNNFEITIARPLARVHHQNITDYKPFGYVQTGPYEVTGTLTAKRDNDTHDLVSQIKGDSTGIALSLGESSNFTISCPDVMIDNSKPEVSDFLLQTIPFRAFAENEASNVISITIA
jgi:hypothetical protein|tara:strand:+ start:314 stop:1294 length:981 start_codon:yes stop_codon:yes gene_type:complete